LFFQNQSFFIKIKESLGPFIWEFQNKELLVLGVWKKKIQNQRIVNSSYFINLKSCMVYERTKGGQDCDFVTISTCTLAGYE